MTSEANSQRSLPRGLRPETPVEDAFLTIGRIVAAHGLRGEVKVVLATDRPEKMAEIRRVYLDGSLEASRVTSFRLRGNDREGLVKLQGVNDRDSADQLRGKTLQIRGNQLPPPEPEAYFHYQILGLQAIDEAGNVLGSVTDIIDAGEVDVYVVTDTEKNQQLFPALLDVITDINPATGRMIVRPQQYIGDDT